MSTSTDIPARLDALAWSPFHTRVAVALGITWVLDGLEVTLAGAVSGALQASPVLRLTDAQVGLSASAYLAGAVLGALWFGWLADRLGRKRLFWVTLGVYLAGTALTALSPNVAIFLACRFITGAGIGGEYAAINSAIQELIPARHRGQADLVINGSFWLGAGLGAVGAIVLLEPGRLPPDAGWRAAFAIGALLGLGVLLLRRHVPESPRWLMTHGRIAEAEAIVAQIEAHARRADGPAATGSAAGLHATGQPLADRRFGSQPLAGAHPGVPDPGGPRAVPAAPGRLRLQEHPRPVRLAEVARVLWRVHRQRTLVASVLMVSQAFFYNAIFFSYALVLGRFFGVPPAGVGLYLLPFAAGNFLGPLVLGRLFDTVGRRRMIALTYGASGLLLLATAALFAGGWLTVAQQTLAWTVVFFFASAAASSAYLTVGESFPMEIRALSIAIFYALGTAVGGVAAPWLFGALVGTGSRASIAWGYAFGASLMLAAAGVAWRWGLDAERRSLEELAAPLSSAER